MSLSDDMQANVNSTSRYYDFVLNIKMYIVCIFGHMIRQIFFPELQLYKANFILMYICVFLLFRTST